MPRKEFLGDIAEAAIPGRFPRIVNIRSGEYDGSISFTFIEPEANIAFDFQAIVSDTHDYPKDHSFLVFSSSENCPPTVNAALENDMPYLAGSTIVILLTNVEDIITRSLTDSGLESSHRSRDDIPDPTDDEFADESELDWESDDGARAFTSTQTGVELQEKLRSDLRRAKNAGFKVGYLGSKHDNIIVSISCRISKLGISRDAMSAWGVKPSEYLVLLISYRPIYLDLPTILDANDNLKKTLVQMHVGLCDSYKPSLAHTREAIHGIPDLQTNEGHMSLDTATCEPILKPLFIGKSLNSLLKERLFGIIRLRIQYDFSWTAAELFYHSHQGKIYDKASVSGEEYRQQDSWSVSTPALLVADHMADLDRDASRMSLPLLAMQFTLRHFTKCTDFCLVCHCKTDNTFEALRPYVCSNGLCLFQYMELDMGPSLEHEIRSQPLVVDLLVSLAYRKTWGDKSECFPTGLRLRVPAKVLADSAHIEVNSANLNAARLELRPENPALLKAHDWIIIMNSTKMMTPDRWWHCRVENVERPSRLVTISCPVESGRQLNIEELPSTPMAVQFVVYDTNLDDLKLSEKQAMIDCLLSVLPSVDDMKRYIGNPETGRLLSSWYDVISPAALSLLRWIVASNRSFIAQDRSGTRHQVVGMSDYFQFRFVQGAADKEQRFLDAINSVAPSLTHPTIFAWHGSNLAHWHNILREGLHFKNINNGRAYGNGVYMSSRFDIASQYTLTNTQTWPRPRLNLAAVVSLNEIVNAPKQFVCSSPHYVVQHLGWIQPRYLFVKLSTTPKPVASYFYQPNPRTALSATRMAMPAPLALQSLSQHVAMTLQQGHQAPNRHVAVDLTDLPPQPSSPKHDDVLFYRQDEHFAALGPDDIPIKIPISIFSGKRGETLRTAARAGNAGAASSSASRQINRENSIEAIEESVNDDTHSIETTEDDLNILLSDDEKVESPLQEESAQDISPKTDFRPGTLEGNSLVTLAPPKYATTSATKTLQHHLNAILKIQNKVPLHVLGWYIELNLISTVYQWIVELHSFDPDLPLAKDLKAIGMKSVVLELRFPPQYPMDPPLARVIRPRFLEFAAGGGGHVTAGGSMCMELLTHSGWLPTVSIDSVLLQVRLAITSTDPRPARLNMKAANRDYSVHEAVLAYRRASMTHAWQISEDIEKLAW